MEIERVGNSLPLFSKAIAMHIETFPEPKSYEPLASFDLIKDKTYPREPLAKILEEYNRHLGNDTISLQNAAKLQDPGSYCVVTGQQLGMFGGPLYTILKGISCLLLARQTGSIPIFWLATEDHDIVEIDHTYCIEPSGNLKRFHLSLSRDGSAVEDIVLSPKNVEEIHAFWEYLKLKEPLPIPGERYADYMTKELIRLFAGTGMVFLEPKLLRPFAIPFFSREIKECQTIREVLKETTRRLVEAGEQPVINVEESTNLFLKDKQNKRVKLRFDGNAFTAGHEQFSLNELLSMVEKEPQRFSCNVAARPVLQNLLLPVIAYVAGPSELQYHRQLVEYHQFHGVSMPVIAPRISATLIPPEAVPILEACGPDLWEDIPTQVPRKEIPKKDLHFLRNLLHPHNEPQARVLNWWEFQSKTEENLMTGCLRLLSWEPSQHYFIYL
jgi:bacillithiol synthase